MRPETDNTNASHPRAIIIGGSESAALPLETFVKLCGYDVRLLRDHRCAVPYCAQSQVDIAFLITGDVVAVDAAAIESILSLHPGAACIALRESEILRMVSDSKPLVEVLSQQRHALTGSSQLLSALIEKSGDVLHDLRERMKELSCLYAIAKVIEKSNRTLGEILQDIVRTLPPAWQYPEVTCARITIGSSEFTTDSFTETPWRQSADIIAGGDRYGTVEVYYTEPRPLAHEGPFIREERSLITAIAERISRLVEYKRSEEALHQREVLLSLLSQKVIGVLEQERERLSRELHDSIGQQIVAMRLEIRWLQEQLAASADPALFANLQNLTLAASEELKNICMDLRPAVLDKFGFTAAIAELSREFSAASGISVTSRIAAIDNSFIPPAIAINIYRIVQECFNNIANHSKAENVVIALTCDDDTMTLDVRDDGQGLPPGDLYAVRCFGILGMKERAKIIGGSFLIESPQDGGTHVRVTFPISAP